MTDIAVIILTKDEKLHIKRCLERLAPLEPRQTFVVDCFSTDGTQDIVEKWKSGRVEECNDGEVGDRGHKAEVKESDDGTNVLLSSVVCPLSSHLFLIEHEWPGLYAKQFNWALDNLPIEASWVLRLDADEYFAPGTIERLKTALADCALNDVDGLTFELKRRFMGGEIRHGTNGIRLLRLWRYGRGRLEDRAMDEHVQVHGRVVDFDGAFYDDSLNTFEWWKEKHRGYARREAMDAISLFNNPDRLKNPSATDKKKIKYYKLPPYFRALAYFCVRYFLKLGFLDGAAGWRWHFWQGLWYRWLVDKEIGKKGEG